MELNEQTDNRIKADQKIAALSPEIKKLMDQLVSDMVKEDINLLKETCQHQN